LQMSFLSFRGDFQTGCCSVALVAPEVTAVAAADLPTSSEGFRGGVWTGCCDEELPLPDFAAVAAADLQRSSESAGGCGSLALSVLEVTGRSSSGCWASSEAMRTARATGAASASGPRLTSFLVFAARATFANVAFLAARLLHPSLLSAAMALCRSAAAVPAGTWPAAAIDECRT